MAPFKLVYFFNYSLFLFWDIKDFVLWIVNLHVLVLSVSALLHDLMFPASIVNISRDVRLLQLLDLAIVLMLFYKLFSESY